MDSVQLALGTAQNLVANSGVSLEGKSGLSIAGTWLCEAGSWDSTASCGYQWRFSRGEKWI